MKLENNEAYRDYINFLRSTIYEHKQNVITSITAIVIAVFTVFLFKENRFIISCSIAVISYYCTNFLLSLYRAKQWEKDLKNAPEEMMREIEEFRKNIN